MKRSPEGGGILFERLGMIGNPSLEHLVLVPGGIASENEEGTLGQQRVSSPLQGGGGRMVGVIVKGARRTRNDGHAHLMQVFVGWQC